MEILFFIYGLSFFVLGFLILFARHEKSELVFAHKIKYLGYFALFHAVVEWLALYGILFPLIKDSLLSYEIFFLLVSYLFLFEFARFIIRKSFENPNSHFHFLYNLYSAPFIYTLGGALLFGHILLFPSLDEIIVAIRYTFGFWGAFFTGIGLYFYANTLKDFSSIQQIQYYLKIAGISFLCYAFFAGIIVPEVDIFPTKYLNERIFFEYTQMPIQFFRTLCAIFIAISSVKALDIFRQELLNKLEMSFNQIKEFNANASHQLKTPLSAIKIQIDVLLKKQRSTQEYIEVLHSIDQEVGSMQELTNNLLLLTRMDDSSIKEGFKETEIDSLILEIIEVYLDIAHQKGIAFEIHTLESVTLKANKPLMHILLTNLLDNAIKYSFEKQTITLNLFNTYLEIIDQGLGIKEEEKHLIFEKFYRANPSKTKQGYGLGLPMVKKIVEIHNFTLFVQSEPLKGTTFTIKFNQ